MVYTTTVVDIASILIFSRGRTALTAKWSCYSEVYCDGWESGKRFTYSAMLNQTWYRYVQRSSSSHGHRIRIRLRPDQRHLVLVVWGFVESITPSPPVECSLPDEPEEVGPGECRPSPSPVALMPREIDVSSLLLTLLDLLPSCSMA